MKPGRPFMSIGEVIDALQPDYPDVTVSKIRFLESAGLIDPERTPAGYRKFYQKDLERLRFILKLQRDSYLPLKVIGERLAEYDAGMAPPPAENGHATPAAPRPEVEPEEDLAEQVAPLALSEMELANAANLEPSQVKALRDFGVICEHPGQGVGPVFDADDLIVARIAREFIRFGIEPRHLKMFRQFADREAMLLQQVVTPMLRHRSPEARKQATQSLSDLSRLVKKLRHAFLRQNLRSFLGQGE
ncbi:MAG TPA: MerR family transcriptional regulator [Actinomycetota bacterium]|nr:MerR family transcriptional regulator [Actinomycetota bacterium]